MGVVTYQIPTVGGPNVTEDPKVSTALAQIAATLNGQIDGSNSPALAALEGSAAQWIGRGSQTIAHGAGFVEIDMTGFTVAGDVGVWTPGAAGLVAPSGGTYLVIAGAAVNGGGSIPFTLEIFRAGVGVSPAFTGTAPTGQVTALVGAAAGNAIGLTIANAGGADQLFIVDFQVLKLSV